MSGTGCAGVQEPDSLTTRRVVAREVVEIRRRSCEGEREALTDTDDDGRANVRTTYQGRAPACEELDMNMNGRVDVTRVYDPSGEVLFEQHDFDFDGRVDQQAFYDRGQLARKELDTNFDRFIDTWIWCQGPFIARLERDRHNTGRVDTWEIYEQGRLATVVYDDNNDGRAERWETYTNGLLTGVAEDSDLDGKPDRPEPQQLDPGGPGIEPVSCNGEPLPHVSQAQPATARAAIGEEPEEAAPEDSGAFDTQAPGGMAPGAEAGDEGEGNADDEDPGAQGE